MGMFDVGHGPNPWLNLWTVERSLRSAVLDYPRVRTSAMTIEHAASIANVVSAVAAMVSAAIAWKAMAQAIKAATFAPKSEAIIYLHDAVAALNRGAPLAPEVQQKVQMAKRVADRVFKIGVRNELNDQLKAIQNLAKDPNNAAGWKKPIEDLEALIGQINREAYLGE